MRTNALLAVVGLAVAASAASADVIARIEVIANNADTGAVLGSRAWTASVNPNLPGGGLNWGTLTGENDNAIDIGGGTKIHGIDFGWIWDPIVTANFNVSSGPVNTTFTVNSAFLSFPTIPGAVAKASAFIGVTDSATFGGPGDIGSVTLTGLQPGGNAFSARYNNNTQTFVNLIAGGTASVGPGGSVAFTGQNAAFPFYESIPVAAVDMQSQFRFSLSRFDRASGTSFFEIVPAPGTAAVLGLGGLLAARRRRA